MRVRELLATNHNGPGNTARPDRQRWGLQPSRPIPSPGHGCAAVRPVRRRGHGQNIPVFACRPHHAIAHTSGRQGADGRSWSRSGIRRSTRPVTRPGMVNDPRHRVPSLFSGDGKGSPVRLILRDDPNGFRPIDMAALSPVPGHRWCGRLFDQGHDPLFGGGVTAVIEVIEFKGLFDRFFRISIFALPTAAEKASPAANALLASTAVCVLGYLLTIFCRSFKASSFRPSRLAVIA